MKVLKFNGERMDFNIVDVNDFMFHISRYYFARQYCFGNVLDLACGIGYGSNYLSTKDSVIAISAGDISDEALAYGRKYFSNNKINFLLQSAINLKFIDNNFDTYISLETMEHIKDVDRYLYEARRVLKTGGTFIVSVPNKKYNYDAGIKNEFHFSEMYYQDFKNKLECYFPNVHIFYHLFPRELFVPSTIDESKKPSLLKVILIKIVPQIMKKAYRYIYERNVYYKKVKTSVLSKYGLKINQAIVENHHLIENEFRIFPLSGDEYNLISGNFIAVCKKE